MKTTLEVHQIYACGCPNALHKALAGLQGIFGVQVDTGRGVVAVEHTDEVTAPEIIQRLREAGYRALEPGGAARGSILQSGTERVP